jgi:hypothetical protein
MGIQYDKEIFSNRNLTLKINFSGVKDDSVIATDLKLSIYAYTDTGQPKFAETLNYEQIKGLYSHLNQISVIRDSTALISGKFIETNGEIADILKTLNEIDTGILKLVLDKLKEKEKINNLFTFLSDYEIDELAALQKRQIWQLEIENLKKLLEYETGGNIVEDVNKDEHLVSYRARQPEKIFQNWIERNHLWIFGIDYIRRHDARTIAFHSEADLLMESIDGFLDLIELKRPSNNIFGTIDSSHKSYYPSIDLSKVIGQCLHYLQKMDETKLILEQEYGTKVIRPRIKIIIGRTNHFVEAQFKALRMLNCQLSHLEIISYDSLLKYGEKMISMLNE